MDSDAILMPGGTRLRSVIPLERAGSCEALYDLERNRLVEVPDLFRYHAAMALETGSPDEDMLSWLAREDLLTLEWDRSAATRDGAPLGELVEMSHTFGCIYLLGDHAHCRLSDGSVRSPRDLLDSLLSRPDGVHRITLHLEGEGGRLSFDHLRRMVAETRSRVEEAGREVSYGLRLEPQEVTPEMAAFLERHPFRVRVRCDGPPELDPAAPAPERPFARAKAGLDLLRDHLGSALTVHSVLREGRLADLWAWARESELSRLHVTKLSGRRGQRRPRSVQEAELRVFRDDLDVVCDDMLEGLQRDGDRTLLYEPVLRTVRRLTRHRTRRTRSSSPCLGVVSNGEVFPVYHGVTESIEAEASPAARGPETDARRSGADEGDSHPCRDCWAQRLCGRGITADPVLRGIERVDIWGSSCRFWRAEVTAGLLFHLDLEKLDPEFLLGVAGTEAESPGDAFFDPVEPGAGAFQWRTC